MTKPREKTLEEVNAQIEDGKKKVRQFENWEKVLWQKLSHKERRMRSHCWLYQISRGRCRSAKRKGRDSPGPSV